MNLNDLGLAEETSADNQKNIESVLAAWQQEKALRQQMEARYQDLYNRSQTMLVTIRDDNGVPIITDCNQAFWETLDYTREEVIGRSVLDFYTPSAITAFDSERGGYEASLKGLVRHAERELFSRDGRVVFTILHAVPDIPDENGRYSLRLMFENVTEQKLAEEFQYSYEKKFRTAFMHSPIPMVITSIDDQVFLDINESFLQFVGRTREDMLNATINSVINLWLQDNYQQFFDTLNRDNRVRNFEIEYQLVKNQAGTGARGVGLLSSERITLNEQTVTLSTLHDITKQKQMERALLSLTDRLQAINEIESSLLAALSSEAIATVALQHFSKLIPCQLAVVYRYDNNPDNALILASTSDDASAVATGKTIICPNKGVNLTKPHQTIFYQPDISDLIPTMPQYQIFEAEGVRSLVFILLVMEDKVIGAIHVGAAEPNAYTPAHLNVAREVADLVTTAVHQANLREELNTYTHTLEEKVQARTAELHLANAELARADRLKDEFLANMSHELRTPLTSILAKSETLQEGIFGEMNEKQTKSIKMIEQSGRHLLSLINDILDLAKIGSGYMELHTEPTPISIICESCLTMVRDMAWKKQIAIEGPKIEPNLLLDIDPQRLKQMLVNLLSNAVKFTPAGGQIGLDVIVDEPAETICFAVWDTGIGIEPDKQTLLFTPFVQLDGGLARQYEGTGLGLALVSQLANLHGGGVSLKSKVGVGSRFMVSLPFKPAQIPQLETAVSPNKDQDDENEGKRPFRILLVEDNPAIAESFSEYLEHLNYPVFIAHNGQMALDMLSEIHPHLILMDIQMPGMNGLEAIRRIRALPEQQEIPIVAVTALAMKGDKERCLQAGATEYVSKPIGTTKLRELAQKYEAQHHP